MYEYDFAIVNKSYAKDLDWSVAMHRSWQMHARPLTPFYVVVPESDVLAFEKAFLADRQNGRIGTLPRVLSEDKLFRMTDTNVPTDFGGWHRQQIVKLCFSKAGIAENYLTVDSQIIFARKFDYKQLLDEDGHVFTAAHPVQKATFYRMLKETEEKGWLDGRLSDMGDVFQRICIMMGNDTQETNAYISCTGMFNSGLSKQLEAYANAKGLDGFAGLLRICPYEFAWYGEYVFSQHRARFKPHSPHIMELVDSHEHLITFRSGSLTLRDGLYGVMLQPPAADTISPEEVFSKLFPHLGILEA